MKKVIFTHLLFLNMLLSFGQNTNTESTLHKLTKLDLSLQGVGVTFERRISNKFTIDLSAGVGGGYDISEDELNYIWNILEPALYVSVTPKFYYNRERRIEKGKTTALNAGNYIGLRVKYTTRSIVEGSDVRDALLFNIHWGLQRSIGRRWTFNSHFGGGYAIDATDLSYTFGTIYPALEFKFSYIISKLKS